MHVVLNFGAPETSSLSPNDLIFHDHIDIYPSDPDALPPIVAPTTVLICSIVSRLRVVEFRQSDAIPTSPQDVVQLCNDGTRQIFDFGSIKPLSSIKIGDIIIPKKPIATMARTGRGPGLDHIELSTFVKLDNTAPEELNAAKQTDNPLLLRWEGVGGVSGEGGTDPQGEAPKILRVIFWDRWDYNPSTGKQEEKDCSFPGTQFTRSPCFVGQIRREEWKNER